MRQTLNETQASALHIIQEQLRKGVDAPKCHRCGCLQRTVEALSSVETVQAAEPERLTLDPAGCVVVYPDVRQKCLVLEHHTNTGVLDCVLEGRSPAALYATTIARHLITRLDHAAYLGRELARAERSLLTGEPCVQDRAPGELVPQGLASCGCRLPISGLNSCEA
jgi:hypothetical protein